MEQKQTDKSSIVGANDGKNNDDLAYENESFVANLPGEVPKANGVSLGDIVAYRTVGTKWNHLVKKRRASRQPSYLRSEDAIGLDHDVEAVGKKEKYDTKQGELNKALISHFVDLAKRNGSDDEVNLDFIEELLKKGADINCRDKFGQGMLHEAARAWHTDVMQFLLESGADANMADGYGRTALHIAAAVDYPEMVELLTEKGAYIEALTTKENQTPLHFAARNDAVGSLKMLIKLGAEVEAKDYKGRTPIFVAAELDRSETARFLVDINADVTVVDNSGQLCMTHMVTKMGPVARVALDQFHKKDRTNRKQYFYLNLLEVPPAPKGEKASLAKTPLEVIVKYRQLDLIMHPVISRLIDVKWKQFGRRIAFRTLLLNLIFVLIWTILGVAYPWQLRYFYQFPQDWWRVFLLVIGCLMAAFYVYSEITEITSSREKFIAWKDWREMLIKEDIALCHPKWPEEKKYLDKEIETLDDMIPYYFQDFWNYLDWIVYFLVFLVTLLHIIDASITNRVPPCCSLTAPCTNFSIEVCDTGFVNNGNLSVWNNRIFVLTIVFLWLRMMKFTRAFRFFGPFIVMLGKLTWDILRFFYLYLEFYIPYSCAFWMIFGNVESIDTMATVDQTLFTLFRITLVDEYQFPEMQAYDIVMAYILISTFLAVSAILCINLFIALLSDTFQRVYDNANANAVMQQAALMLNFEENLRKSWKKKFRRHIEDQCSPESLYYDDDLTTVQDSDLKKVTIKIKEQMDELLDRIHKAERAAHPKLEDRSSSVQFSTDGDEMRRHSRRQSLDEDEFSSQRGGRMKPKAAVRLSDVVGLAATKSAASTKQDQTGAANNEAIEKMSTKMTELSSRMQRLQVSQTSQEESYKSLRNEIRELKNMLLPFVPGGGKEVVDEEKDRGSFQSQPLISAVAKKLGETRGSPTRETSRKSSGLFRKILGSNKQKVVSPKPEVRTIAFPPFAAKPSNQDEQAGEFPSHDQGVELVSIPGSISSSPQRRRTEVHKPSSINDPPPVIVHVNPTEVSAKGHSGKPIPDKTSEFDV